jgi:hypothetical protein
MKTLTSIALVAIFSITALGASASVPISKESLEEWISEIDLEFTPLRWIPSYGESMNYTNGSIYSTYTFSCVALTKEEKEEFYTNLRASYTSKGYTETVTGKSSTDGKEIVRRFFFENDEQKIFLVFVYIDSREAIELIAGPRKSLDNFVVIQTIDKK